MKLLAPSQKMDLRLCIDRDQSSSDPGTYDKTSQTLRALHSMIEHDYAFHEVAFTHNTLKQKDLTEKLLKHDTLLKLVKDKKLSNLTFKLDLQTLETFEPSFIIPLLKQLLREHYELGFIIELKINLNHLFTDQELFFKIIKPFFELQEVKAESELNVYFIIPRKQGELFYTKHSEILATLEENLKGLFDIAIDYLDNPALENLDSQLESWKEFFSNSTQNLDIQNLTLPFAEKNKHDLGRIALLIQGDHLYHMPKLYRLIPQGYDFLKVQKIEEKGITEMRDELLTRQLLYAGSTHSCAQCNNLISCSGNYVQALMEAQQLKDCVFPLDLVKKLEIF
jgi:hypothetical protein